MSFDSATPAASRGSAAAGPGSENPTDVAPVGVFPRRAMTMGGVPPTVDDAHTHTLTVYLHAFNPESVDQRMRVEFHKRSTTEDLIERILNQGSTDLLSRNSEDFDIYETMGTLDGRTYKERRLDRGEYPVTVETLWPRIPASSVSFDDPSVPQNRFVLRRKGSRASVGGHAGQLNTSSTIDSFLAKFLQQPQDREYADLCLLPELTEQTLLDNLRDRFNSGHIYTYIGPILVAVNPFSFFPIYNPKYSSLYCQSRRLGALPPHIFAIADITYHNMMRIKQNQCMVISGESGSGKTESTNFLLHHLTTLSQKGGSGCTTEQMLLSAGPVLEAFGNAVTVQNNNSSRFGKFIKVNYRENGIVSGANVEIYLLEKSRIISQAVGERNYHVFYYLLEGISEEERSRHFLLEPKDYYYLNQNSFFACEVMDEKYEFERLKHSMDAVGFSASSQQKIFGMISSVLLLGNVEYIRRPGYHSDESAFVGNEELLGIISELLNIRPQALQQALTTRRTVLKRDTVVTRHTVAEAVNTRDAMSKCLYNALFHWIVLRINQALVGKESRLGRQKDHSNGYFIGILDIFGFEDVGGQWNSYEQLCINYANEHLQAYFNQHIFLLEQEEYLKEGIQWTNIEWTDNTECLQLFQNKPYGLWRLIDEESNINNATDRSMLEKLEKFLKSNEYYEVPHKREDAFTVAHYAGKVKYQIAGFREKNKDLMRPDVMAVLKSSRSAFVRELVGDDPVAVYRWALVRSVFRAMFAFRGGLKNRVTRRAESVDRLLPPNEPSGSLSRRASDSHLNAFLRGEFHDKIPDFCDTSMFATIVSRARKTPIRQQSERQSYLRSLQAVKEITGGRPLASTNKPTTVSKQFEYSLARLMKTLAQATPYFIRCIKSNNEKIPNYFDDNIILRQLRYTGMLETVRIRRAGYSVRIEYDAFKQQYRILLPNGVSSSKEDIQLFIKHHPLIEADNLQYGATKIFMRDAEKLLLDDHLHRVIMGHILTLQSWFKTVVERKRYLKLRDGVIRLQALFRGVMVRSRLRRRAMAALCIQCWWRGVVVQRRYRLVRAVVVALQAVAKGREARRRFEELRDKARGKRFGALPPEFGKIECVTPIELARFDLNDPSTLAAFADEDDSFGNFDSDTVSSIEELEDEALGGAGGCVDTIEEVVDEEDDEDDGDGSSLFAKGRAGRTPKKGDKRGRNYEGADIGLDASFILEDARLKLIGETDVHLHRRQSLATTTTSPATSKMPMAQLRRAASTDSDQLRDLLTKEASSAMGASSMSMAKQIASSKGFSSPAGSGGKPGTFVKARRQLRALLGGRGAASVDHGAGGSSTMISEATDVNDASRRSMSTDMNALARQFGHNFKLFRVHKAQPERCSLCNRPFSGIFVHGYKCGHCKLCFHKECCNFAANIPCTPPLTSPTRSDSTPTRKPSKSASLRQSGSPKVQQSRVAVIMGSGTFNLTKTKQQTDSTALIIESTEDLRQFSVFIFKKQLCLEQEKKRETIVDAVFKRSLRELHMELIGMEAVLTEGKTVLKYRDLITTFEGLLTKTCHQEKITFPTTLGVNAFRGFLNEFMQQREKRKSTSRSSNIIKSVRKKRRRSDITLHNGHRFMADFVHVPTYCESCNQFMWHAEKIFICTNCRLSCHKRCHTRVAYTCAKASRGDAPENRFFGAELSHLVDEDQSLPCVLNKLLMAIEVKALFVEGIYRKSGALAAIRSMRLLIETSDPESLEFNDAPVHVLTSLVKAFFRELPEPLITYELYENFINVSEVKELSERVRCLRAMTDLLPKSNKCLLDRLMYHLARVAHQESVNRMTASNLAVIFAPCILRRSQTVHAQEQLMDVQHQALCVQTLIEEKLRQYRETVNQIVELENASEKVTENLRRIDEHRRSSGSSQEAKPEETPSTSSTTATTSKQPQLGPDQLRESNSMETARQLFEEQLDFLDKEKDKLIRELPPLSACPVASTEDLTATSSGEEFPEAAAGSDALTLRRSRTKTSIGEMSMRSQEEYAIDFNTPPVISRVANLGHSRARVKRPFGARLPSGEFMSRWRREQLEVAKQPRMSDIHSDDGDVSPVIDANGESNEV